MSHLALFLFLRSSNRKTWETFLYIRMSFVPQPLCWWMQGRHAQNPTKCEALRIQEHATYLKNINITNTFVVFYWNHIIVHYWCRNISAISCGWKQLKLSSCNAPRNTVVVATVFPLQGCLWFIGGRQCWCIVRAKHRRATNKPRKGPCHTVKTKTDTPRETR